jgi:PDZ domain-containing secreted protein
VDPGSAAEALGLEAGDLIDTIDGQRFQTLDALIGHLRQRELGKSIPVTLRRWSQELQVVFDYHVRDLPAESFEVFGPGDESVSIAAQ